MIEYTDTDNETVSLYFIFQLEWDETEKWIATKGLFLVSSRCEQTNEKQKHFGLKLNAIYKITGV